MLLVFKTGKNTYGTRKYLAIDTDSHVYTTTCHRFIVDGIEIKARDYKTLLENLENLNYQKVEHI